MKTNQCRKTLITDQKELRNLCKKSDELVRTVVEGNTSSEEALNILNELYATQLPLRKNLTEMEKIIKLRKKIIYQNADIFSKFFLILNFKAKYPEEEELKRNLEISMELSKYLIANIKNLKKVYGIYLLKGEEAEFDF